MKGGTRTVSATKTVIPTYLVFPPPVLPMPMNLEEVLGLQAQRLTEIGAAHEAKIDAGKYRDELAATVKEFTWSTDLAGIGLDHVAVVDYRLRGAFLAEVGGINCRIDPDKCRNFEGVETPDGLLVIQAQWGTKFKNKAPRNCRKMFATGEQGGVPKEGFTALIYEGNDLLRECYHDYPGSISERGCVPYLRLSAARPFFYDYWYADALPRYGSVSRGSVVPLGT